MNVTTINITTVGLSNTESEVNYEYRTTSYPCVNLSFECGQCSPNRAGGFPITRLSYFIVCGNHKYYPKMLRPLPDTAA